MKFCVCCKTRLIWAKRAQPLFARNTDVAFLIVGPSYLFECRLVTNLSDEGDTRQHLLTLPWSQHPDLTLSSDQLNRFTTQISRLPSNYDWFPCKGSPKMDLWHLNKDISNVWDKRR